MLQVAQNTLRKVDPNSAFLANFQSVYNLHVIGRFSPLKAREHDE